MRELLYHKNFANDVCVDFIGFRLADVVFAQGGSLDRVEHTLCNQKRRGIEQGCRHSVP